MPTCKSVAAALRNLADSLEKGGDAEIVQPFLNFSTSWTENAKDKFRLLADALPQPVTEEYPDTRIRLRHNAPDLDIWVTAERAEVCTLIEPAKAAVYAPLFGE